MDVYSNAGNVRRPGIMDMIYGIVEFSEKEKNVCSISTALDRT
jgi:hypothetical protein